jgi:hypothetical protein
LVNADKRPALANRKGVIFYQDSAHQRRGNYKGKIKETKMGNSQLPTLIS